jgi:signal transduction histidine kinase/HPt (histidine-containing phosphotransfer) domain-containing protein/ActR/RegA family two-component response regulator
MPRRLALATTPIIALVWLGLWAFLAQTHHADLAEAGQTSRNLTRAFEENIRRSVEAIDTTIRALRVARAHDPEHFDLAAWERDSGLNRDLTLQLSIADRFGAVIASNLGPSATRVSIADRPHFRVARDKPGDTLFISRPVIGRVSGKWSVQFVRKLFTSAGEFDGVIVASLDPAFLSRFYGSLDVGRGALLLIGQDGLVRAAAPQGVAELASDLSPTSLMAGAATAPHGSVQMIGTRDGIERIYSWRRVDPFGLIVAVGLSTTDALAEYRRDLTGGVPIGLVLTLITLSVGTVLARNRRDASRSQAILRAAVDNISQGLLVVDADRRVPVINGRAAELLGLPAELARPDVAFDALLNWQISTGEFEGDEAEPVRALVRAGGIEQGSSVYQRIRRNGTVLEFRTRALESGLAVRTITDVTEQQQHARALSEARDAAEAAAQARSEFLAVMSHEIRTPLNGVIGVADLLAGMKLDATQLEYVRLIRESGSHLLDLINDILDFSRLEASRMQLEAVEFEPNAMMRDVAGLFQAQASAKGLSLSVQTAEPRQVIGDPGRLRQVLLNLFSNAVKFTSQGGVTLTLEQEPAEDGRVTLRFRVADTGIGIAPEALGRIFDEFTQVDGSISRRFGGSGLGLAICRRLTELMGGTIAAESQPGSGSVFRFEVPLPCAEGVPVPETAPEAVNEPDPAGVLRVLVAEDNPTNRLVAVRLLERLGHQADTVGNGAEAVAALGLTAYDVVLMDVMMPEMDGLTATRQIRAAERPGSRVAIVGLTAGSRSDSLAECLTAGMDAVTTKPVTLVSLRTSITEGLDAVGRHPGQGKMADIIPAVGDLIEELGEEAVREILATFADDTNAILRTMREAAARGDTPSIFRAAHSVAGAARNVGATALARRASRLEHGIGSYSAAGVAAEIVAMQADLDAALAGLGLAAFDHSS